MHAVLKSRRGVVVHIDERRRRWKLKYPKPVNKGDLSRAGDMSAVVAFIVLKNHKAKRLEAPKRKNINVRFCARLRDRVRVGLALTTCSLTTPLLARSGYLRRPIWFPIRSKIKHCTRSGAQPTSPHPPARASAFSRGALRTGF